MGCECSAEASECSAESKWGGSENCGGRSVLGSAFTTSMPERSEGNYYVEELSEGGVDPAAIGRTQCRVAAAS